MREYLTNFRERGACAEGIVKSVDANMLTCNGGHILNGGEMGMVKRRASTKAKVSTRKSNFYWTSKPVSAWRVSLWT